MISDLSDSSHNTSTYSSAFLFKKPELKDGLSIHELVENCPPLDLNSSYCYMLCSSIWADTSVCSWQDNTLSGFVSALIRPDRPDTLFIWQVAVARSARGQKLASQMIKAILERDSCSSIRYIHTTISPDNNASWGTFRSLARELGSASRTHAFLDQELHFRNQHESEDLFEIGPLKHR
ncbi:diaminobutyrate acetyltransferase [Oceanospirillum sp. D5]|uniref:L-2,4-diaminobutyric acid acetyltransferase n=2 Tax=Oceanospirillum sediminis TaxID=2760088 RepID=A0A839IP97_9GAMM|nr:diaminobutyrate acetyltransferase [Oceanospirillum sediminis]